MNLQIFAVRDIKTANFATPMFLTNKGHALRSFADEVNRHDDNNILNKHPEDFELYYMGDYNTETGFITAQTPMQIVTASELIRK